MTTQTIYPHRDGLRRPQTTRQQLKSERFSYDIVAILGKQKISLTGAEPVIQQLKSSSPSVRRTLRHPRREKPNNPTLFKAFPTPEREKAVQTLLTPSPQKQIDQTQKPGFGFKAAQDGRRGGGCLLGTVPQLLHLSYGAILLLTTVSGTECDGVMQYVITFHGSVALLSRSYAN